MKLVKINLSKGKESNHPDIKPGRTQYLAKIDNRWHAGSFSRQWYGLNFQAVYDAGLQFDTPGTNHSRWQELYLIKS